MQQGRCQYNEPTLSTHWTGDWSGATGSRIFDLLKRAKQQAAEGNNKGGKRLHLRKAKWPMFPCMCTLSFTDWLIVCVNYTTSRAQSHSKTKEIGWCLCGITLIYWTTEYASCSKYSLTSAAGSVTSWRMTRIMFVLFGINSQKNTNHPFNSWSKLGGSNHDHLLLIGAVAFC